MFVCLLGCGCGCGCGSCRRCHRCRRCRCCRRCSRCSCSRRHRYRRVDVVDVVVDVVVVDDGFVHALWTSSVCSRLLSYDFPIATILPRLGEAATLALGRKLREASQLEERDFMRFYEGLRR